MTQENDSDWEHALWSSLCLELLCRAALANVSPALLAETDKSWASLYNSLGFVPKEPKFSAKSISSAEVFRRLREIFPQFNQELESFCVLHTGRRNAELHSGETPFAGIPSSGWQPRFYKTCETLLATMSLTLEDFIGPDEADVATKLMTAAADESAKSVKGDVDAHSKVWHGKSEEERVSLAASAIVWATRQEGHRVKCPSCGSTALVGGEAISAPNKKLDDDQIIESREYLPTHFECIACGLKILGLSRLAAVGLGERYKKRAVYDAAEYYAPDDEWAGYEDDNNDPF